MNITQYRKLPREVLDGIQVVHHAVFEEPFNEKKLEDKENLIVFVCSIDGEIAGFKMGYEIEPNVYYSWLGGVHPKFQKRGIAQQLMVAQHIALKDIGYEKVRTYSRNNRKAMLMVNLKNGFDIIDTFVDNKGRHKICLEKML